MFEFGVDVALLQGALISSLRNLNTTNFKQDAEDSKLEYVFLKKKECMEIAHTIVASCSELIDELCNQSCYLEEDYCKRRMHAAMLYVAMNNDDKLKQNDDYFESLIDAFPNFGWNLYFEIVKAFQWNDFYVECISSLPLDVVCDILQLSVDHCNQQPIDDDDDASLLLSCVEIILELFCNIDHKEELEENLLPIIEKNSSTIILMWSRITCKNEQAKIKFITFILTLLLSICSSTRNIKNEEIFISNSDISDNQYIMSLVDDNQTQSESIKNKILFLLKLLDIVICGIHTIIMSDDGKTTILNASKEAKSKCLKSKQGETPFRILIFRVCQDIKEFLSNSFIQLDPYLQKIFIFMKEILDFLNSEFSFNLSPVWIQHGNSSWTNDILIYECNEILEWLWTKKNNIPEDTILEFLERNKNFLSKHDYLKLLMDIVIHDRISQKEIILKIILNTFESLTVIQQQDILKNVFENYGMPSIFKSTNFESELICFLNQVVQHTVENKVDQKIYTYCLQSSPDVIMNLILQSIKNNRQITILSEMFKDISFVCNYKEFPHLPSLFIKCFCNITSKPLSEQEQENAIILVQILTQIKGNEKKAIIPPDDILLWCILPYLNISKPVEKLNFSLKLLQITAERIAFNEKKIDLAALVLCLYQLLEYFTVQRNAGQRQIIFTILFYLHSGLLRNYDISDKPIQKLLICLKSVNPMWYLHLLLKFENREISTEDLRGIPLKFLLSGGYFEINEETICRLIQKTLNKLGPSLAYSYLVVSLSELLLYSTFKEWKFLYSVICSCNDSITFLPGFQLSKLVTKLAEIHSSKAIHVFIDALILLCNSPVPDIPWQHVIANLSKLIQEVKNVSSREIILVVHLFCEMCRLASVLNAEYIEKISISLLDLASQLVSFVPRNREYDQVMLNCLGTVQSYESIVNVARQFDK